MSPSVRAKANDVVQRKFRQEMEKLYNEGKIKFLGISNVSARQLQQLIDEAKMTPHFVQNMSNYKIIV